jgi:hypothetical protein
MMLSRRELLRQMIAASAGFDAIAQEDDLFLDELERANFLFFWEQTDGI